MAEIPPTQFAAYPRGNSVSNYGTVEQLEALGSGYFGLNTVFTVNLVIAVSLNAASRTYGPIALLIGALFLFAVVAALSYPQNQKIAYGKSWPNSKALLASILMGLNSALCCGLVGYVVMQNIAMKEMKLYGIQSGLFGLKKKDFENFVANRRNQISAPFPPVIP